MQMNWSSSGHGPRARVLHAAARCARVDGRGADHSERVQERHVALQDLVVAWIHARGDNTHLRSDASDPATCRGSPGPVKAGRRGAPWRAIARCVCGLFLRAWRARARCQRTSTLAASFSWGTGRSATRSTASHCLSAAKPSATMKRAPATPCSPAAGPSTRGSAAPLLSDVKDMAVWHETSGCGRATISYDSATSALWGHRAFAPGSHSVST
jgi:hypothetical protein